MTRNLNMLVRTAQALGELGDEVVFVGGAVVELFITDPAAPRPRFTEDVDVVVEVTTHVEWNRLSERLRKLGFREDPREGAPLCRWLIEDLVVDVMPVLERVLGFTNRWYRMASKQSEQRELPKASASVPSPLRSLSRRRWKRSCRAAEATSWQVTTLRTSLLWSMGVGRCWTR